MRLLFLTLLIFSQAALAQSVPTDANMFRSIFATVVDPDGANPNKVDHLIYAPVPSLLSGSDREFLRDGSCHSSSPLLREDTARRAMCAMQKAYGQSDALAFFSAGKTAGQLRMDLKELTQNLKEQDLLIVVVPGIFGEFIKGRAFEEVFEKDSAYAREFKARLAVSKGDYTSDVQNQLSRLTLEEGSTGAKNVHMGDLLNVGSIDDDNGQPLTKVVLFQMDGMTLESLGLQKDKAEIFNRRLKKFFQIMQHTPKNIAFVGYSRGTAFALEMLSQAKAANEPWLPNVRAVVSLGGVVFGSALADDVVTNKNSNGHCQLELVDLLNKILTPLPNPNEKPFEGANKNVLLRNTMGWYRFLVANARFGSGRFSCEQVRDFKATRVDANEIKALVQFLIQTGLRQKGTDPDFGRQMIMSQAVKFGFVNNSEQLSTMELLKKATQIGACISAESPAECLKQFAPDTGKYNTDILRFRKLVEAAQQGVEELSTDSRLQWWREHTIPTHGVRFYSVSGTMAEESSTLVNNRYGYNPRSPDDNGLIQNWKDYTKVAINGEYAGVNLNDSQVAIYKTAFWPNIIASLNPTNAGVRYTPLAVVGTHHWGMALPIVTEVRAGSRLLTRNPFPRAELMHSIALSIANDIRVDAEKGE